MRFFRQFFMLIEYCDVRSALLVIADGICVVHRSDAVAVGHDDQVSLGVADIGINVCQSLQPAPIVNSLLSAVRRQDGQTAVLSGQIPLLAVSQMVHQRLEIALGNDTNILDARVNQVGKHEINQTISAAKRDRRHGAVFCQLSQCRIVHIRKHNSQCFIHHRCPPPEYPSQSSLLPEPSHSCQSGFPWR